MATCRVTTPHTARASLRVAAALALPLAIGCQQDLKLSTPTPTPPDPVDTDDGVALRQPDIEVTPAALDFGGQLPNCPSKPEIVTIANVGDNPLNLNVVEMRGAQKDLYTLRGTIPQVLRAGESIDLEVIFTAPDYFLYENALVYIESNDPDESIVRVPASGEGTDIRYEEDQFLQQQPSGVDILWVLDNSGSMSSNITKLRNSMNVFVQNLVNLGLDYRLAITTTLECEPSDSNCPPAGAPGPDGQFVGAWMDGATTSAADVIAEFTRQTNLVANSVGDYSEADDEEGMDAAYKALSAPRINQAPNAGFLRPDATLAVAVLSDEGDNSNMSTADFVNWFAGLKGGDLSQVSFSGITPNDNSYRNTINQTGGIWTGIGTADINPYLQFLAFVAAGLEISFPLAEKPTAVTPQALTVQVCDATGTCTTIQPSAVDGYTYNPTTNEIEMNGSAIPDPGESVVITYPVATVCAN